MEIGCPLFVIAKMKHRMVTLLHCRFEIAFQTLLIKITNIEKQGVAF